jgi:hypothetical protein
LTGFTTDYVNQIAINLRDRYKTGFPILKELVQNADDAGAESLAFGYFAGHGAAADHMLLKGPALWVLNDGGFKDSDRRAIRSFGLNAKAGDSGVIGKFGLGMKSVFHLCESFFYLASHAGELSQDFLNPWRAEDYDCAEMHQQWETVTNRDVGCLETVARAQPEVIAGRDWFLLWVPLRQQSHVPRSGDRPMAAIIERYPGENPTEDLDFFSDPRTDQRIGALLPLLRHLKQVRFAGAAMREPFTVVLESQPSDQRLNHETDDVQISGTVRDDRPRLEHLHFLVRQRVPGAVKPFGALRAAKSWPTSMVITESGTREPRPDKAAAEAAVMFAHADKRAGKLDLQWAVFLPAEDKRFSYEAWIPGSSREYRIVLHGQFFVDAGRRGIADMDMLDKACEDLPENPSQHVVLRQWNQALAQQAALPEFLPGLSEYVKSAGLRDDDIASLTHAIAQCAAAGDAGSRVAFFSTFQPFICRRFAWIRRLSKSGARWELVEPTIEPVLSLPAPPLRDHERPWRSLPGLLALHAYAFADAGAPSLTNGHATWEASLLLRALKGFDPQTLKSETDLDYLANFLEMEAARYVRTGDVQDALVELLRTCLQGVRLADVRQHRKIFKRIVQLLSPDRIFTFGPQDPAAKGAIAEALYRTLLKAPTRALPVPADLGPDGVTAITDDADLGAWLDAMMRHDVGGPNSGGVTMAQLLDATERVIRAAGDEARQISLLRQFSRLKVLRAYKGADGVIEGVSLVDLTEAHARGWLFKVTDPNRLLGFVQKLALALPEIRTFVVRSAVASYVDGVRGEGIGRIPSSEDAEALLSSAGAQSTPPLLGDTARRADLLTLVATAKLENEIVIRGVRFLLHGSPDHYLGSDVLWKDPVGQKSPWVRLWRMIDESPWRVLVDSLCSSIPDKCAQALNVKAVDESSVLNRLRVCNDFSRVDAAEFTSEEIDLLLGRVSEEHPWMRLPLHRDFDGGRDAVQGECFLGKEPELPEGLADHVRFIEPSSDPDHLRQQNRFLRSWDAPTAASVVLKAARPVQHWRYLMDLLGAHRSLAARTPQEWIEVAWLPLESGGSIALSSLISISNLDAEIRDLARRCDYAYASPKDLSVGLRAHPSFPSLLAQVSSGEDALPVLGQMMSEAGLSIGQSARSGYRDLQPCMSTLVSINLLPAWGIIERATVATSIDAVEKHLVPEVAKQLSLDICSKTLAEISDLGLSAPVPDVFGLYLREWRASAPELELREVLSELRLLSMAGTWEPAAELVAGVHGVMPKFVVSDRQFESLDGIAVDNRSTPTRESTEVTSKESGSAEDLMHSLEVYFEPLVSSSVKPSVGAVIGLFGERVASLAKSWLFPIAYDDYLAKLGWRDPGVEDGIDRRVRWMGNRSLDQALRILTIRIAVLSGNHVSAKSLTGASLQVLLAPVDEAKTLFVMTDRWQGYTCRVQMRPSTVLLDKEPQQQRDILMRTGESLLKDLYNQQHANLSELFALADEADQVTLDVARGLILEGLPQSLRSLPGIGKNKKLAQALANLDAARRGAASAKRAGRSNAAAASLENALSALAALVESDEEVQGTVLAGIKARVTHNQYEVSSIPFELFQNADDAVIEMQQLQQADGRPEFAAEAIGRFVMKSSGMTIRFAHWGRPINYAGRLASYKAEFANDLERMLMLGASAKDEDEGVTGKFGLGFKSVLLASSTPRVWSGDLCFDVVAGCLPRKWKTSPETKQFQQTVQTPSQRALRGTLIELPLDSRGAASDVTERFAGLAGLLPVFARQLRCVVVGQESHTWQPRILRLGNGVRIETGSVSLPVEGGRVHSAILVFRAASGSVVLRIGAAGIEDFDRKAQPAAPSIWVTAPTRGTPARGALLNAPFQIDTGRATLALGKSATQINTALVQTLAKEVSPALIALQAESETNWTVLAAELGCAQSVSKAGFWYGLWETLLGEAPEQDSAMDVRLLDSFACGVFRNVVERTGRVPNGMRGDDAALVQVDGLCLSVNLSYLASVMPALRQWRLFIDKHPVDGWCAEPIYQWLHRSALTEDEGIPTLVLGHVVGSFDSGHLPPAEISNLAKVISAWPSNLGEPHRWRMEMAAVYLCSRAGTWVPARALIRGNGVADYLLSRFAPDKAVLHSDYASDSAAFQIVEQYLPAWSDDTSVLAGWCMAATGADPQAAAANWLARNIYSPIIEVLRARLHQGGWLFELTEASHALDAISIEERRLLLAKLGLTPSDQEDQEGQFDLSPSLTLDAIHGWWCDNSSKWLAEFDSNFWPTSVDRNALKKEDPYDRTAWMTLFSLGLFRRYGRVTDQQHRGFLDFVSAKGWWHTICEVHPDDGAEAWMNILRAYSEGQQTETLFELWMDSFPRLYRIARWLDTYVHLFRTIDSRDSKLAKFLLSPASDPSLSGSGIEAPTLSRMLRLGQHLVVRELLRLEVLSSPVACELAFAPRRAVLELMAGLGYGGLRSSADIHQVLVSELGEDAACFADAYDIPLQLVATNKAARLEAERWAVGSVRGDFEDVLEQEDLL